MDKDGPKITKKLVLNLSEDDYINLVESLNTLLKTPKYKKNKMTFNIYSAKL